jgi:hypothetical protein
MCESGDCTIVVVMPRFLLHHTHAPQECPAAFAAWKGFSSPLRSIPTIGACLWGRHEIWWQLDAAGEHEALAHLPPYVADRTEAIRIGEVRVP